MEEDSAVRIWPFSQRHPFHIDDPCVHFHNHPSIQNSCLVLKEEQSVYLPRDLKALFPLDLACHPCHSLLLSPSSLCSNDSMEVVPTFTEKSKHLGRALQRAADQGRPCVLENIGLN